MPALYLSLSQKEVLHTQLEILYSSYLQLNKKYLCFIFIRNTCLISIKRLFCQLSPKNSDRKKLVETWVWMLPSY